MLVFDRLISLLSASLNKQSSVILVGNHERVPVRSDAFVSFLPKLGSRLVFVDGGNGEILSGAEVSVQFIRLCALWYEGNVRVERVVKEFFVVVTAVQKDLDLGFEAKVLDFEGVVVKSFSFDAFDPLLCSGGRRAEPSSVAGFVRRLLEFDLLRDVLNNLSKGDILVRDGDLESRGCEDLVRDLRNVSLSKGVVVLGLSKTSRLCTDSGVSAVRVLRNIAPVGCWFYYSGGSVGFVKLHPSADYVFRFDCFAESRDSLTNVFSALAFNSIDPAFLGYPYGLLDADRFAQVPTTECSQLRARFAVQSKEVFRDVGFSVDAHDILDSL